MVEHSDKHALFNQIWDAHVIGTLDDGRDVLFVDRHLVHDVSSPQAFSDLRQKNIAVLHPELTFATADHIVATQSIRSDKTIKGGQPMIEALRAECRQSNITLFDLGDHEQGIIHVTMSEMGIIQPGNTVCCGDSHTCTLGALGSLALAIGTSETTQVLASQTIFRKKPKSICVTISGTLQTHVLAKDVILHIIAKLGTDGAEGYAIEFSGSFIAEMPMEARFTLCNMASEMGAVSAIIGVDQITWDYMSGRAYAPKGQALEQAMTYWSKLKSPTDTKFDKSFDIDVSDLSPQITWGTRPDQVIDIDAYVPGEENAANTGKTSGAQSRDYMGLKQDTPLLGQSVDVVFLGSCTNARLSDLRVAASILKGRKIASGVRGVVVPGSTRIRQQAEHEGLAEIFTSAGFEWRQSGCSMCAALNADRLKPLQRCISTSNRNFEGRQGVGGRTHLASPVTAAACAIAGKIIDVRTLV